MGLDATLDRGAPSVPPAFRDRKRWGWLLSVVGPALALAGPLAHTLGATSQAWFHLPLVVFYFGIPLADALLGEDRTNPAEELHTNFAISAGGEYLAQQGAKHILCHIQVPGAVNLETRCEGVIEGAGKHGAKVTVLRVPANLDGDVTGTAEAIKAELIGDPSIATSVDRGAAFVRQSPSVSGRSRVK